MKALQFTPDGKMKFLGAYNLNDVNNNAQMQGDDIRFTLYTDTFKTINDERVKVRVADCLLIDIDDCPMPKAKLYKLRLRKLLHDRTYTLVYSGGGLHIYIPITYGFTKEDKKFYKKSYDELCDWLGDELKCDTIDKQVFGASKFGRVLGSTNTKYDTTVELLDVYKGGSVTRLSDMLTREEVTIVDKPSVVTTAIDSVPFHSSPIYKYCNFIKHCDTNKETIGYETWSDAINILSASGNRQHCHDISRGHKDYDFGETEAKITSFDNFVGISCFKINEKHPEICSGCKFLRVPQMSASTITGSRTTVSLHRGHFYLSKNDDAYAIDYNKLDVDSLIHHFLNINEGKLRKFQGDIYRLDETDVTWKVYFSENFKEYGDLTTDLENLTQHELKPTMLKKVIDYLKVMLPEVNTIPETPSNLVVFKSNVFNTDTSSFRERLPEDYITGVSSTDISNTTPTKWLKFLDESIGNKDDINLLQEFFGLALSRLKTYDYQYVCWLYGLSGTGKSLIQTILGDMIGDECSVYFTKDELLDSTFNVTNVNAKTFLAVSEVSIGNSDKMALLLEKKLNVLTDSNLVVKKLYSDKETVTNRLTTIVTSNDAPPIRSMDQGGARRIRAIEFYKTPKEVNHNLRNELLEELPSIANWAIEGLFRVLKHGVSEITDAERNAIEASVSDQSSVSDFVDNALEIVDDAESMIATNALYAKYEAYCDTHKLTERLDTRQLSIEIVTKIQRRLGVKSSLVRKRSAQHRLLRFIKWKV